MNSPANDGRDVCVVSLGAATPIGQTAPATAAAVRAGIAGFVDHPYMIDRNGDPFVVACAPYLEENLTLEDRLTELALSAAREASELLSGMSQKLASIPAFLGIPTPRPGLPDELGSTLSARLTGGLQNGCRVSRTQIIPTGHSAGLMAVEAACRAIQAGGAEFCLAGGVDSYLDADTLEWVEDCEQLHQVTNAWGFVPGEAAGFCLLCSSETAQRYELSVWGKLITMATAEEKNLIKTETVCIGEGLSQAVRQVLQSLPPETLIDDTVCDMNGEAYRADEFGFMLSRTSEHFVDASDFLAPADCWGDVGAASGPLFALLAAAAGRKQYAKGPRTLLWTSSEGGQRTAAVIQTDPQITRTG